LLLAFGCKTSNNSQEGKLKLGNAFDMGHQEESSPYVHFVANLKGGQQSCSGVFVSQKVIVTAAHCLVDHSHMGIIDPRKIQVKSHFLVVEQTSIDTDYMNPSLSEEEQNAHDLGLLVVRLPDSDSKATVQELPRFAEPLNAARPKDILRFVSFGGVDLAEKGYSRTPWTGTNVVDTVDDRFLYFSSKDAKSTVSRRSSADSADDIVAFGGDSGGPVLKGNLLVGILVSGTSGIGILNKSLQGARLRAINLNGVIGLNFLQKIQLISRNL
ncbi:MAG: trypsin-like serine protease, partial [Proteobacteria bacterium]|nr:trypsin-like serine protease [Pseudomonadota bacterium]